MEEWNWDRGDTRSYITSAEAFLEEGSFLSKGVPDSKRTIGYPILIAGIIGVSEALDIDFRKTAYIVQAVIYALVYPAIYFICVFVFKLRPPFALLCVLAIPLLGNFISYVPLILSDALFATTLIIGVACSFLALKRKSVLWGVVYTIVITYSANVRPMLAFFPFAMLLAHLAWLSSENVSAKGKVLTLLVAMFISSLLGVQTPALRNWINHNVFTPTENGPIIFFKYLGKDVLNYAGQQERFKASSQKLQLLDEPEKIGERIKFQNKEALNIFLDYPVATVGLLAYNTVLNSLEMHWQNFFVLQNKTWYRDYKDSSVLWSPIPFMIALLFVCVYGAVYTMLLFSTIIWEKNYYIMSAVAIFLIPYVFCGTNYQGARFRLWLEPFVVLIFFLNVQKLCDKFRVRDVQTR